METSTLQAIETMVANLGFPIVVAWFMITKVDKGLTELNKNIARLIDNIEKRQN